MNITKNQIILALKSEPLRADYWVQVLSFPKFRNTPAKEIDCTVCAVGAVLRRNTNFTPTEISEFAFKVVSRFPKDTKRYKPFLNQFLEEEDYLSALSCYFESTIPVEGAYGNSHRNRLVNWVKRKFPDVIAVDV